MKVSRDPGVPVGMKFVEESKLKNEKPRKKHPLGKVWHTQKHQGVDHTFYETGIMIYDPSRQYKGFFPYGGYATFEPVGVASKGYGLHISPKVMGFAMKFDPPYDVIRKVQNHVGRPEYSIVPDGVADELTREVALVGPSHGRGKVLFTEDKKYVNLEKKRGLLVFAIYAFMGLAVLCLPGLGLIFSDDVVFNGICFFILLVPVTLFLSWMLYEVLSQKPVVYYLNGFINPKGITGKEHFYRYREYHFICLGFDRDGEYYILETTKGTKLPHHKIRKKGHGVKMNIAYVYQRVHGGG